MKRARKIAERGRVVRTRGWVQGTWLPPELRPRRRRTRAMTRVVAPRKSIRFQADSEVCLTGILTVKKTRRPDAITNGTWMRKAVLQPHVSFIQPPKTPPSPAPVP